MSVVQILFIFNMFLDQRDLYFSGFHTMGGEHAMEHYDVCIGPNLTCMNDLLNRMGQFDHVEYNGEKVADSGPSFKPFQWAAKLQTTYI